MSLRTQEMKLRNVVVKIGSGGNWVLVNSYCFYKTNFINIHIWFHFWRSHTYTCDLPIHSLSLSYFISLCIFLSLSLRHWNIGRCTLLTLALTFNRYYAHAFNNETVLSHPTLVESLIKNFASNNKLKHIDIWN